MLSRLSLPILCSALLVLGATAPRAEAKRPTRSAEPAPAAPAEKPPPQEPSEPPQPDPELAARVESLVTDLRHPVRRSEARAELKTLGQAVTPVLLRHADDPDHQLRWEIANVQGDLHDPRAIPQLVEYVLHDENPHVRWRSLWALREYPEHANIVARLGEAHASERPTTHWNAAVGLSMFDDPSCLPTIHEGLGQADEWRSWEAINALGRVHDGSSVSRIEAVLATAGERFRRESAVTLGLVGGPEAAALLVRLLGDEASEVRWRAAMSLGRIKDKSTLEALRQRRLTERDSLVNEHLSKAIARIAKLP